MQFRRLVPVVAVSCAAVLLPVTSADAAAARTFANCTAMHKVYPHGVGKVGARDRTSGKPVTTFKRSNTLYAANKKSDRDKDGVACEKR
ncbi:excalibur calcium-binding domain-containing protein [Jatrophihabitans fulvus]